MRIDWQKYESGELSPEEMRIADEFLRTDENARKELEGLRSFRNMVRTAALNEHVPHSRLRQILKSVVGHEKTPLWQRSMKYVTIAAGAIAMAFLALNFFDGGQEPDGQEARKTFESELAARTWAIENSGMELPTLQLASLGTFDSVHCGKGWACFDYIVDNQIVHVYMKKDNVEKGCSVVKKGEQEFFVNDNISFDAKGVTVSVKGGTEDVRWKVVDYTRNEPKAIY